MRIVTYNVQFGVGLDGRYDVGRIAEAVRGADVIALQEVTRNNPRTGFGDMVAELRAALPDYFAVFGPNFDADVGSRVEDGKAVDRHFQFGNMVLSKTPILTSRNLLLPRTRSIEGLNLQRGALEALIETPLGFVRFYSTHLDHRSPRERLEQVKLLKARVLNYPQEGGAISGAPELGFPEPPHPEAYVLMGDFNMLAGTQEYEVLCGRVDHEFGQPVTMEYAIDAARRLGADAGDDNKTWLDPKQPENRARWKRIDYVFVSPLLAGRLKSVRVDRAAVGSDHQPVWVELG
ncbi:MAG: endonuclease/exonuclease/phosphatase family protein [Rhizobiaceae bacterium]|nr:endonuclease/exonuclease/phosphatase family protein [Rhizobiaceae bacterium]